MIAWTVSFLVLFVSSAALAQEGVMADPFIPPPTPAAIPDVVLGLHPLVWPALAIGYYVLQILDTMIPEAAKAGWPTPIRLGWDWVLTNVGHSTNSGSANSPQ